MKRRSRARVRGNRTNRIVASSIENESATSRRFRRQSLRHGPIGNILEQTLRRAKRSRRPPRSGRNRRWRTVPNLGHTGIFSRASAQASDRPTNRLGEIVRVSPGIHGTMKRGMHARFQDRSNRRFDDQERIGNVKKVSWRIARHGSCGMLRKASWDR